MNSALQVAIAAGVGLVGLIIGLVIQRVIERRRVGEARSKSDAILREAGVMLDGALKKVTIQAGDEVGVEAPVTVINSEKGILACDTNMCVNHVYANTVEAYEFIEKSE